MVAEFRGAPPHDLGTAELAMAMKGAEMRVTLRRAFTFVCSRDHCESQERNVLLNYFQTEQ